jgi:anti-sigma regulatory factor (Ser/Thr protein kinase)
MNVSPAESPDSQPSISMRLHGGTGASFRARKLVLSQLGGRLTEAAAADVALILSELVTNSVLHAHVGYDQTLTVECTPLPDRLRITVTDPGSRLEPQLRSPDRDAGGGYGLRIVELLSSAWGVVRDIVGATSVWCDLPLESLPQRSLTDREHPAVTGRRTVSDGSTFL